MIDWLSHTPMDFEPMGAIFDTLHIADAPPLALSRPYEAQERDLKDRFPDETDAIEAWTAALRAGRETMYKLAPNRAMPDFLGHMLQWWNGRAIDTWCPVRRKKSSTALRKTPTLLRPLPRSGGITGGARTRQASPCTPWFTALTWNPCLVSGWRRQGLCRTPVADGRASGRRGPRRSAG